MMRSASWSSRAQCCVDSMPPPHGSHRAIRLCKEGKGSEIQGQRRAFQVRACGLKSPPPFCMLPLGPSAPLQRSPVYAQGPPRGHEDRRVMARLMTYVAPSYSGKVPRKRSNHPSQSPSAIFIYNVLDSSESSKARNASLVRCLLGSSESSQADTCALCGIRLRQGHPL